MTNLRGRSNSSSKCTTKPQDVQESSVASKKRAAKKILSVEPQVENVESEAPSSDNRLQAPPSKVSLSSRKQTSVAALQPTESVAVISDFSAPVTDVIDAETKLSRSLLPSPDGETNSKKRKRVLPSPTSGLTATQPTDKDNSGDEADEEILFPKA